MVQLAQCSSVLMAYLPVGGAAGMVSKITGSMGKGLAAITMDKEFQQKRREEMNRQPKDFSDSLAKGGKGLLKVGMESFVCVFSRSDLMLPLTTFLCVQGVVGGVTGIVTKPVEGRCPFNPSRKSH